MRSIGALVAVFLLFACERAPNVHVADSFSGGFLMNCFAVTDLARRGPCDPNKTDYMHNNRGGCVCAQGGTGPDATYFTLPPVVNGRATGAIPFNDNACFSSYASACVPRVVVLSNGDWNEGTAGQLHLDRLARRLPNTLLGPTTEDMLGVGTQDRDVAARIAREAEANIENYSATPTSV
jgi:hypothetical protein